MVCYLQNDYLPTLQMTPPVVEVMLLYHLAVPVITAMIQLFFPHRINILTS